MAVSENAVYHVYHQVFGILIEKMMMGVPYFQNPYNLPDSQVRASASPSTLQGPACFTALRTLALPALKPEQLIMWTDDGYTKTNLQYPNFTAI